MNTPRTTQEYSSDTSGVLNKLSRAAKTRVGRALTGVALAGGVLAGPAACSSAPESRPTASASAETVESAVDWEKVDPAVEVIASPLVVTEIAKQRTDALLAIDSEYAYTPTNRGGVSYTEKLAATQAAIDQLDPSVRDIAQELFMAKKITAIDSATLYVYGDSEYNLNSNRESLAAIDAAITLLPQEADQNEGVKARNGLVASSVLDAKFGASETNAATEALVAAITDETLQGEVQSALNDESLKAELTAQLKAEKDKRKERVTTSLLSLYEGSSISAELVNSWLADYQAVRAAQPDETLPGLKDEVNGVLPEVYLLGGSGSSTAKIKTTREIIDTMPQQYADTAGIAHRKLDALIATSIADYGLKQYGDTKEDSAIREDNVDEIQDSTIKKATEDMLDIQQAAFQAENVTATSEDDKAELQAVIAAIEDPEIKDLAMRAAGGDTAAKNELTTKGTQLKQQIGDWQSAADNALFSGSNAQAKFINERANKYLAANQ